MRLFFAVVFALMLLNRGGGSVTVALAETTPAELAAKMTAIEKRVADLEKAVKASAGKPGEVPATDTNAAAKSAEIVKSVDDRLTRIEAKLRSAPQSFADVKQIAKNTGATWNLMYWVLALVFFLVVGWVVTMLSSRRYLRDTTDEVQRRVAAITGMRNRPLVASVVPAVGVIAGETPITIKGQDFQLGAIVKVGGNSAAAIVVAAPDTITARTPPGLVGPGDVTIENRDGGISTLRNAFTYIRPAPIVRGITPATGPAGTPITIWGADFQNGATMTMDGVAVPVTWRSGNDLTAAAPPTPPGRANQLANVVVTNPDGQSSPMAMQFTYP